MNVPEIRYRIMILVVLLSLVSCGEAQPAATATAQPAATATAQPQAILLGKWRIASISLAGQVESPTGSDAKIIFEFTKDGSLTISEPGSNEEPQKGSYTLNADGQMTLNINAETIQGSIDVQPFQVTIQGSAEINDEQFVLAYDEPRPRNRLRQVNAEGTPINAEGTPVKEAPPIMDHVVMTFERVR